MKRRSSSASLEPTLATQSDRLLRVDGPRRSRMVGLRYSTSTSSELPSTLARRRLTFGTLSARYCTARRPSGPQLKKMSCAVAGKPRSDRTCWKYRTFFSSDTWLWDGPSPPPIVRKWSAADAADAQAASATATIIPRQTDRLSMWAPVMRRVTAGILLADGRGGQGAGFAL